MAHGTAHFQSCISRFLHRFRCHLENCTCNRLQSAIVSSRKLECACNSQESSRGTVSLCSRCWHASRRRQPRRLEDLLFFQKVEIWEGWSVLEMHHELSYSWVLSTSSRRGNASLILWCNSIDFKNWMWLYDAAFAQCQFILGCPFSILNVFSTFFRASDIFFVLLCMILNSYHGTRC